jgi:hypothetical protein
MLVQLFVPFDVSGVPLQHTLAIHLLPAMPLQRLPFLATLNKNHIELLEFHVVPRLQGQEHENVDHHVLGSSHNIFTKLCMECA